MSPKILRIVVLLFVVGAVQAGAEDGPDLRVLLNNKKYRIFTARLTGVTLPPEPVSAFRATRYPELLTAIAYWLRVGKEYEVRAAPAIAAARRRDLVFRTTSLADVLFFQNRGNFSGTDLHAWTNIALATAMSGDFKGGAEILDGLTSIMEESFERFSDYAALERTRDDAVALWIQYADARDDIHTLLEALSNIGSVPSPPFRDNDAEAHFAVAHFNKGRILEKLGLYKPAIESYRRSLEESHDQRWNEEALRRINRISQPSPQEQWLEARASLKDALGRRAMRRMVALFPAQTRIAAEKELLAAWARGALVGSQGDREVAIARRIGAAREHLFADSLVADAVRAVDDSIRGKDGLRVESVARGSLLYEHADTAATFDEAAEAFDMAKSPMASAARFFAIVARFDAVHVDESLAQLRQLERAIPAGHRVLRAMVEGAIGNCLAERGELEAALETYTRARRVFEASGEADAVASMRASAAHMLNLLGDPAEAWHMRLPALRWADASGDPTLVEFVLRHTASDELFNRREWRALMLYGLMLPMPPLYAAPLPENQFSRWRNPAPLHSKQVMLDALNERPLSAVVQNDLRVAQAISLYQRKPRQAEALLSESIAFAETTGRVAMLPHLYFYRAMARCEAARGADPVRDLNFYYGAIAPCEAKREDDAVRDLEDALALLEERGRNTVRRDMRGLWSRVADDPFAELINLHGSWGDESGVFVLGERQRGMASGEPLTAEEIAERLKPGVAVIAFTATRTRLPKYPLAAVIEKDRVGMHRLTIPAGNAYFRVQKLRVAIEEERAEDVQSIAEDLFELLIRPLAIDPKRIQRLVVVADHPLHDVPFALLRDRKAGQYLIEQFELMRAPSASIFARTKSAVRMPVRTVVALGDPAFDRKAYPSFPSLPGARGEAIAIGRQYPRAHTLIGRNATLPNLAASVRTADVVHIATHTAATGKEGNLLNLLLAPSRRHAGACSTGEAAALPLKKDSIVVVPGCRTGGSPESGALGDFAGSFLAAGARNVVATLWDVHDDTSRPFALLFHRALRRSGSAVTAMREAQLAMLRSPNVRLRNARAWSGFQVYGTGD